MKFLFSPSGRIGRLAWWGGQVVPFAILVIGFVIIGEAIGDSFDTSPPAAQLTAILVIFTVPALSMWINFALSAKRFHDRDKSAAWFLIVFVPLIGGFWQLIECGFLRGDDGVNSYGPPGGGSGGSLDAEIAGLRMRSRAAEAFAAPSAHGAQPVSAPRPQRSRSGHLPAGVNAGFGRRGI